MATFKEQFYADANKYICRVNINGNLIPYTRLKKYNVIDTDSDKHINLYNLITDKCDEILLEDVGTYIVTNTNIVKNIKYEIGFVNNCKLYYKRALKENISEEVFMNLFQNKFIVENDLQETIYEFNYQLDLNSIYNNTISGDFEKSIKEAFINIVQNKANESKEELENLKKDCDDDEDIEDIESIIEMFDDSVSSINLDNVKSLTDLADCWPPLLLPLSNGVEKLYNLKHIIKDDNIVNDKLQEMKDIVLNIDDLELLEDFRDILVKEENNIDKDKFEKYLETINNKIHKMSNEEL